MASCLGGWVIGHRAMHSIDDDELPEFCTKDTLILGCGNILFGDDGFGPTVADCLLAHFELPGNVYVMDAGTGVRKLLFTLCLSPPRQRRIFIIDAIDKDRDPGEIFEMTIDDLPPEKIDDFSLHQVPSSNLAKELREAGVEVRVLVCQVDSIPDAVAPGLSEPVCRAVPAMCEWIVSECGKSRSEQSNQQLCVCG